MKKMSSSESVHSQPNEMSMYVRNKRNDKIGFLVAQKRGENVISFGWAFWHPNKDKYDRNRMKNIAWGRAGDSKYYLTLKASDKSPNEPYPHYSEWGFALFINGDNKLPAKYDKEIDQFLDRASRYFGKDEKAEPKPKAKRKVKVTKTKAQVNK